MNVLCAMMLLGLLAQEETPIPKDLASSAAEAGEPEWTAEASLLLGLITFKGDAPAGAGVEAGARLAVSRDVYLLVHYRYLAGKDGEDSSKPNDTFYFGTPGYGTKTSAHVEMEDAVVGVGLYVLRRPRWTVDLHLAVGVRWAHVEKTVEDIQNYATVSSYEKTGSGTSVPAIFEAKIRYLITPAFAVAGGLWADGTVLQGYGSNHGVEVGLGFLGGLEVRF